MVVLEKIFIIFMKFNNLNSHLFFLVGKNP